jgi:hypothetical protein
LQPVTVTSATTAAQQQGLVSDISTIVDLIRVIGSLRDRITSETDATDSDSGATDDVRSLQTAVARLEEGQKDLQGRLINNAGISRAIGEKLVEMDDRLAVLEERLGPDGEFIRLLGQLQQEIRDAQTKAKVNTGSESEESVEPEKKPVPAGGGSNAGATPAGQSPKPTGGVNRRAAIRDAQPSASANRVAQPGSASGAVPETRDMRRSLAQGKSPSVRLIPRSERRHESR